jgi:uncharacterized protein (DUF1778 family)
MAKKTPIPVRFEPEQRAALERAAAEEGESLSEVVRDAVKKWMRNRPRRAAEAAKES